jgi:hypothetical protein
MEETKRTVGINVLITFFGVLFIFGFLGGGRNKELALIFSGMVLLLQLFVNLILAIVYLSTDRSKTKAFLLSSLTVLLIGFSFCSLLNY